MNKNVYWIVKHNPTRTPLIGTSLCVFVAHLLHWTFIGIYWWQQYIRMMQRSHKFIYQMDDTFEFTDTEGEMLPVFFWHSYFWIASCSKSLSVSHHALEKLVYICATELFFFLFQISQIYFFFNDWIISAFTDNIFCSECKAFTCSWEHFIE